MVGLLSRIILLTPTIIFNIVIRYNGFADLAAGLCCGFCCLAAGQCIGVIGDVSTRAVNYHLVEGGARRAMAALFTRGRARAAAGGGEERREAL